MRKQSSNKLRRASDHLHYEYWMLISIANGLSTHITDTGWLHNALIESFVIHYRALYDFFFTDPEWDDVAAGQFFESPVDWARIRPAVSALLKDSRRRAGKEIAHLTYARQDVTPETKPWRFAAIATELQNAMKTFLDSVSKERLGKSWNQTNPDPLPLLFVPADSASQGDIDPLPR